ncbi:hypothetical protein JG687_00002253 [Phytophthora cactorum]|uniref:Sulfurtransferase n=2 Tax=Phytophthora cactorum TaxID=29920 RepID=A0A8T1UV31_9STRA|nr:hypothetical protein JG687_00002253 [Phytophthora cactorum]
MLARSSPLLQTRSLSSRLMSSLSPLLSTEQAQSLWQSGERRVCFLDASWYLDKSRDAKQEFASERLPGAQFFDIEQISDTTSTLPHMLPKSETFEHAMMYLGVESDDTIIVYGGKHCFSPARCWWTFKYFGHENVHILNGGITKWKSEKREIETGEPQKVVAGASYTAKPNEALAVSWEDVLDKIDTDTQIVDARGAARFFAKEPEPRPGMRGGHIPGSVNVPFGKIVSPDDYSLFRDLNEIKSAFAEANVKMDGTSPVFTTCGSGVTASVLTFGLHLSGKPLEKAPVYDGSWSEWGMRSDLPLETEAKFDKSIMMVGAMDCVRLRITEVLSRVVMGLSSVRGLATRNMPSYRAVQVQKLSKDFRAATKIVDVPELPTAGPDSIVVKNRFLGINSTDVNLTNGMYHDKLPFFAGVEGAGLVTEVGNNVTTVKVGDAVMYQTLGAYADYVQVPASAAIKIPELSMNALPVAVGGVSASICLEHLGEMKSNETILVTAAAGGTGQFVVQLAKLAGNHVIGTTSSDDKVEALKKLGCDRVINYKKENVSDVLKKEYPSGVDIVFESIGGEMFRAAVDNIAVRGRIIKIGFISRVLESKDKDDAPKPAPLLSWEANEKILMKSASIRGFFMYHFEEHIREHTERLLKLINEGKLRPGVDPTEYKGFESIPDAIDRMFARENVGKLIVQLE